MNYMGSKRRIAKEILPIMLKYRTSLDQWWIEPFVGGGNMIENVKGNRLGADGNYHAVEALRIIRDEFYNLPRNNEEFTEEDYKALRRGSDFHYKSFAGFAYSYGAKWMGGWSRNAKNKRDYVEEAFTNAAKQSPKLKGVRLINCDYLKIHNYIHTINNIIYCDPPYENTSEYHGMNFDHNLFWMWCRNRSKLGDTIFISEYKAPEDFQCIWQKEINSSLTKETGAKKGIEKLFVAPKPEMVWN